MITAFERTALSVLWSFAWKALLVMALIALAAVLTPYMARFIDAHRKPPEPPPDDGLHSIFEADRDENFDPNYKIYNTDIYGVEKRNGKKQRKDG